MYADGNDLLRRLKLIVQKGEGMIAEAKLSRRQDSDSVHSGKVVHTGTETTGMIGQEGR